MLGFCRESASAREVQSLLPCRPCPSTASCFENNVPMNLRVLGWMGVCQMPPGIYGAANLHVEPGTLVNSP